jgi:VanZ family protein
MLDSIMKWNPWTWVALLYISQILGAGFVIIALGLSPADLSLPISLLAVGAIHALLLSYWNPSSIIRLKQHWVPAFIYSAFIFSLSNKSFSDTQVSFNTNLFHPVEYAVLAIFFCWMWHTMLLSGRVLPLIVRVLSWGMVFALLDELHQSFIAGRDASGMDLVLDFVGLCIGCTVFFTGRHILNLVAKNRATQNE